MDNNRNTWLMLLSIIAIIAVRIIFFTGEKRDSQYEDVAISNNRMQLEREIRKMIKEDSLCCEFFRGIIPAYISDTIPGNQAKWFNENVSSAAKVAFKAKWDSLYKNDSMYQTQVLFGILSENPRLCGADKLSDSDFEILQERESQKYAETGRRQEVTPEEIELLCSGIKMPDGSLLFQ